MTTATISSQNTLDDYVPVEDSMEEQYVQQILNHFDIGRFEFEERREEYVLNFWKEFLL